MIRPSGQTMVDIKSNDYKKIIKSYQDKIIDSDLNNIKKHLNG